MVFPTTDYRNRKGPLPEKQQKVIDFIRAEIAAGKGFPSDQIIADHMGWKNPSSSMDCLYRLRWRGLVHMVGKSVRELA